MILRATQLRLRDHLGQVSNARGSRARRVLEPCGRSSERADLELLGRLFSKLRRRLCVANLCAMAVGAACLWPISDTEIMAEYESRAQSAAIPLLLLLLLLPPPLSPLPAPSPPLMTSKRAAFLRLARAHRAQASSLRNYAVLSFRRGGCWSLVTPKVVLGLWGSQ